MHTSLPIFKSFTDVSNRPIWINLNMITEVQEVASTNGVHGSHIWLIDGRKLTVTEKPEEVLLNMMRG